MGESAFKELTELYGTLKGGAPLKRGYTLPRAPMENADIARIINSNEIQSVLRAKLEAPKGFESKRNPLKNKAVMKKLNPLDRKAAAKDEVAKKKKARVSASKAHNKKHKKGDETFYKVLMKAFETKVAPKEEEEDEE